MTACRLLTLQKVQRTISDNCAGRDFMTGVDGTTGEALCSEPQPNFSVRFCWEKCNVLAFQMFLGEIGCLWKRRATHIDHAYKHTYLCLSVQAVQRTISGSCENNQKMIGVNSNGSPNCVDEFIDFTVGHGGSE